MCDTKGPGPARARLCEFLTETNPSGRLIWENGDSDHRATSCLPEGLTLAHRIKRKDTEKDVIS